MGCNMSYDMVRCTSTARPTTTTGNIMNEHRHLNYNSANRERTKLLNQGHRVTQIIRDTFTGGYIFGSAVK